MFKPPWQNAVGVATQGWSLLRSITLLYSILYTAAYWSQLDNLTMDTMELWYELQMDISADYSRVKLLQESEFQLVKWGAVWIKSIPSPLPSPFDQAQHVYTCLLFLFSIHILKQFPKKTKKNLGAPSQIPPSPPPPPTYTIKVNFFFDDSNKKGVLSSTDPSWNYPFCIGYSPHLRYF